MMYYSIQPDGTTTQCFDEENDFLTFVDSGKNNFPIYSPFGTPVLDGGTSGVGVGVGVDATGNLSDTAAIVDPMFLYGSPAAVYNFPFSTSSYSSPSKSASSAASLLLLKESTVRRRSVKFCNVVHVCETIRRDEYTPEEIKAVWYTEEETTRIRDEALYAVGLMDHHNYNYYHHDGRHNHGSDEEEDYYHNNDNNEENDDVDDEEEIDTRGLEAETPDGFQRFQLHRRNSLEAVLAEQERQWLLEYEDDYHLGAIYHYSTLECKRQALEFAKKDAAIAQEYYSQTSNYFDRRWNRFLSSCGRGSGGGAFCNPKKTKLVGTAATIAAASTANDDKCHFLSFLSFDPSKWFASFQKGSIFTPISDLTPQIHY